MPCGKFRLIDHVHIKGSGEICEDMLVCEPESGLYGVIDGATSLDGYRDENGKTGGYLAARLLGTVLRFPELAGEPLRDRVLRANRKLLDRMREAGVSLDQPECRWAAAFAVVLLKDGEMEYVQAGDCMLYVQDDDGTVRALTRDTVSPFDRRLVQKRARLLEEGVPPREVKSHLLPDMYMNRSMANRPQGYSVMNGHPALGATMDHGTVSLAGVRKIAALTDGLFDPRCEASGSDSGVMTARRFFDEGLSAYARELLELEEQDPDGMRYPRLKKSDDKTGWILQREEERR